MATPVDEKADVQAVEFAGVDKLDSERGSTGYAKSASGDDFREQHAAAIRKLFFKLDILIMPMIMVRRGRRELR